MSRRTKFSLRRLRRRRAKVSIALRKPEDFRAEITLDQLQINARKSQALKLGVQPQDVQLKNAKPVTLSSRPKKCAFNRRSSPPRHQSGSDRRHSFRFEVAADLAVRGSVNLAILQLYNSDLLARGNAPCKRQ